MQHTGCTDRRICVCSDMSPNIWYKPSSMLTLTKPGVSAHHTLRHTNASLQEPAHEQLPRAPNPAYWDNDEGSGGWGSKHTRFSNTIQMLTRPQNTSMEASGAILNEMNQKLEMNQRSFYWKLPCNADRFDKEPYVRVNRTITVRMAHETERISIHSRAKKNEANT